MTTAESTLRIVAAGLTPAWQHILSFDQVRIGEVNRAVDSRWCGSGKVLNVGIALTRLQAGVPRSAAIRVECRTLSLLGGPAGHAIEAEFAALGVDRRWIESEAPTRVCTTVLDRAAGTTTELVENAAAVTDIELDTFRRSFQDEAAHADVVVLTGSLPAGAPATFYRELLEMTSAKAVLDCRGPELLAALERKPLFVKPNRDELARTVGRSIDDDAQLYAAMHELNERGAEWVVVSAGAGAVSVTHAGRLYQLTPPAASQAVNPIGSGDCLAAGLALGAATGLAPVDAIRWGIAAAVDNVNELLPARINAARVATLFQSITMEEK